ncbi:hypothetical protein AB7M17_008653 [Bradyrhizobium sp. USDA 377]
MRSPPLIPVPPIPWSLTFSLRQFALCGMEILRIRQAVWHLSPTEIVLDGPSSLDHAFRPVRMSDDPAGGLTAEAQLSLCGTARAQTNSWRASGIAIA